MAADRGRDGSGRHCYSLRSANSISSSDLSNASTGCGAAGVSSSVTCESICTRPGSYHSPGSVQSQNRQPSHPIRAKNLSLHDKSEEDDETGPASSELRGKRRRKKFVGVRQRPSGRWVAEIKDTTQKIRLWLGTFDTAEEAAHAYDEAACLLRGTNTRTNFVPHPSTKASPLASKVAHLLQIRRHHVPPGYTSHKIESSQSAPHPEGRRLSSSAQQPLVECLSSNSENEDEDSACLTASSRTPSMSSAYTTEASRYENWKSKDKGMGDKNNGCVQVLKSCMIETRMESGRQVGQNGSSVLRTKSQGGYGKEHEIRSSQWKLEEEEEEEKEEEREDEPKGMDAACVREEQMMQKQERRMNDEEPLKLQRGSYMDAVLGINDDILGSTEIDITAQIEPAYYSPFDFGVESSLSPTMQVDDFPLISELSDQLAEASENAEDQCDETLKRIRLERRMSASLYAVNGVHEMLKQSQAANSFYYNMSSPLAAATNSSSMSSFHFSSSPSYLLSSPWKPTGSDSVQWKTNQNATPAVPPLPGTSTSGINFPLVDNLDPQSQEAMWNSWDLSPLCPLSVA